MTNIDAIRREIERNKNKERVDQGVTWMCPNTDASPDTLARMAEVMLEALDCIACGELLQSTAQEALAECTKIAEEANGQGNI